MEWPADDVSPCTGGVDGGGGIPPMWITGCFPCIAVKGLPTLELVHGDSGTPPGWASDGCRWLKTMGAGRL
jgi:hypothetical protein